MNEEKILYTNNLDRKSFQWELWHFCNSLCKFCYLGKENRLHNKERQITSIIDLGKAVDKLDYTKYNNISIIGGEFFQGQLDDKEIHDNFFEVIKKIFKKYLDKKIGSIWITCTLTIGDQKHLYELLEIADQMEVFPNKKYGSSGLWLCTSWDSAGRFHNNNMENNWKFHMKNIKSKYPWVKFNTTIILQQDFIEKYINDEFSPKKFMEEYKTTIFYKQPGVPSKICSQNNDENKFNVFSKELSDIWLAEKQKYNDEIFGYEFFPKRKTFLKFLSKYYAEDKETYDRLFNIEYRADELHRNFNDIDHDISIKRSKFQDQEEDGVVPLPCGHIHYYASYSDSNKCCVCDKRFIENE